jgi:hypothetical protein
MNKEEQKKLLIEIMDADAKDGLYKQQTAMQTLWEWIDANCHEESFNINDAREMSMQKEKEQLNKACYDGYYREDLYDTRNYYNDTYTK